MGLIYVYIVVCTLSVGFVAWVLISEKKHSKRQ